MNEYILELQNISKSFPGVNALNRVDFSLKKGEVHALVGENGAGKSLLLKIICGICHPDSGIIRYKGVKINFSSENAAMRNGIVMLQQEVNPIGDITVGDNIFLAHLPRKGVFVDRKKVEQDTLELFKDIGMPPISPRQFMHTLSTAQKQMVEVAKAVAYRADVLVLDEPTSSVSAQEVDIILAMIDRLRRQGISIIYTSHKMNEILRIADRVTILRDGQRVECQHAASLEIDDLIIMMSGHKLHESIARKSTPGHKVRLELCSISAQDSFQQISLKLHEGEVLCLAGLVGAKRTQVARAVYGLQKIKEGKILINGSPVRIRSPRDAIRYGMAYVPEDRRVEGLYLEQDFAFNLSVTNLHRGFIHKKMEQKEAAERLERLKMKVSHHFVPVSSLSGGNQQKVVFAKWRDPDIFILDEPTRGIDISSRQEIYAIINALAESGKAILLISSDLAEVIALSDKVIVMNEGRINAVLTGRDIFQENIMKYAVQFQQGGQLIEE